VIPPVTSFSLLAVQAVSLGMRGAASRTLVVFLSTPARLNGFPEGRCFPQQKCNRLLDCEQTSLIAAYHAIDSKSGNGRLTAGLWQVGLWQEGDQAAYSHGQFRSIFSVKLFVELSRPRPDFIDILAPTDASSADVDWIKAELSRADRYPSRFKIANTGSRATLG
jgi:hypothetical protein